MTVREDKNNIIFKEIKKDMEIKDNQLTINIPDGMEIDLQNCDFDTGVIKFRKKELTYEDIKASLKLNENMICISVDEYGATPMGMSIDEDLVNLIILPYNDQTKLLVGTTDEWEGGEQ